MQTELAGKTAIITGANRGIGREISRRFARGGAHVILSARDSTAMADAVAEIQSEGGLASAVLLDLRMPDSPAKLAAYAIQETGHIDIVVNNAGATRRGEFSALTDDDWIDGFALKLFGAVRLTRAAWPHLKQSGGSVLFIA